MNDPILLSIRRVDDHYLVTDALERVHSARNEEELGKLIAELLVDEDLPRFRLEKKNDLVTLMARVGRRVLPEHRDLLDVAEPMVHVVTEKALAYKKKRGKRASAGGRR